MIGPFLCKGTKGNKMSDLYVKNSKGEFKPISFKEVVPQNWDDKLIIVRVGSDENPANDNELDLIYESFNRAEVLENLNNTSIILVPYTIDLEVLSSLKDIKDKCVSVRVTEYDDLSKLESLQKQAKSSLRNKVKKVVILPTPLTVDEYKEVMEIKKRCDIRKQRRGN